MASNGWQEIPLGCLGTLRKGVDFGYHQECQEGSGIPVVKVKDFGDRLFVPHGDLDELDDSQIAVPQSQLLQNGDIVLIRSNGNSERLGLSMIYRGSARPATFSGCCIRFRPDTKRLDSLFAAYLLRSPICRQGLAAIGCGTGIHNLSQRVLAEMPVPLPPLGQQKSIAHILSTLDDKINLNGRMNGTLEAIVSAIFKSWFVDFDPVRTKAGLPKSIGDLFPDHLIDTELGKIPEGWEVQPIREVIGDLFDGPHATPPESAEGPVFLRIANLTGTRLDLTDVRHISEEHWSHWTENVTPQFGDIVFSYEAVLGSFALIPPDLRCCLGRRLALIRPRKSDPFRYFLFHSFVSAPFQRSLIEQSTHGSTVNRVPIRKFPDYRLVWPPARVRSVFDDIAEPFWALIHRNQKESRTLAEIRDALLPKLLSGELRAASEGVAATVIDNSPIDRPKARTSLGLVPSDSVLYSGFDDSFRIFQKNLERANERWRMAADTEDCDHKSLLIGNVIDNAVIAFIGFGQLAAETHKNLAKQPQEVSALSFQNLAEANGSFRTNFGFGLSDGVTADEWKLLVRCFQKRNLIAHKMGVTSVDDHTGHLSRKVTIDSSEVSALLSVVEKLGGHLRHTLAQLSKSADKFANSHW